MRAATAKPLRGTFAERLMAVLVLAVLLLSALVTAGVAVTASGASPVSTGHAAASTLLAGLSPTQEKALVANPSDFLSHLTAAESRQLGAYIASLSPSQFLTLYAGLHLPMLGASSPSDEQSRLSLAFTLGFNWPTVGALLGVGITGCVVGGILGAPAAGVGAGVGCLVGAAVAIGAFFLGTLFGAAASNGQLVPWEKAMAGTLANEMNVSSADFRTELSTLNSTVFALETEADAVALAQLPNTTFNRAMILQDSTIAAQLASVFDANLINVGGEVNYLNSFIDNNFGTGAQFGGSGHYWSSNGLGSAKFAGAAGGVMAVLPSGGVSHEWFWVAQGANVSIFVQPASTCVLHPVETYNGFPIDKTYSASKNLNWTFGPTQGSVLEVNSTGSGCTITSNALLPLNPNGAALLGGEELPTVQFCSFVSSFSNLVTGCNPVTAPIGSGTLEMPLGTTGTSGTNCFGSTSGVFTPDGPCFPFGTGTWIYALNEAFGLMNTAVTSASVYWSYLHSLGYFSASSVPAGCTIPFPSQVLPPAWSQAANGMNATQMLSLYEAWLNGLAVFFNTPPSTSNFCNGHPPYNFGNSPWTNLFINAFGFVYIPNATDYPHQVFVNATIIPYGQLPPANTSTWALNGSLSRSVFVNGTASRNLTVSCWQPVIPNNARPVLSGNCTTVSAQRDAKNATQLLIWPLSGATLNIPVGRTFEVPLLSPSVVFAVEPNALFSHVTGNGTSAGYPRPSFPAGSAIFLTSCIVNGTRANICPLSLSTISGTIANFTGSGSGSIPFGGFGSACTSSPFIGWFTNPVGFLFGGFGASIPVIGGALQTLGCIIADVLFVGLILGVLYVAVRIGGAAYAGTGSRRRAPRGAD